MIRVFTLLGVVLITTPLMGQALNEAGAEQKNATKYQNLSALKDSATNEIFDIGMQDWVINGKTKFFYDNNGNHTSDIAQSWLKGFNVWVLSDKNDFQYDAMGNLIQEANYSWSTLTNKWVCKGKHIYSYNSQHMIIQEVDSVLNTILGGLIPSVKNEYSYDGAGYITSSIRYMWDDPSSQWANFIRSEFLFDNKGNDTLEMDYSHDETDQWVFNTKLESAYNASGKLTKKIAQSWLTSITKWIPAGRFEYTYNNYGIETQLFYAWDFVKNNWFAFTRDEYSYDADGNQIQDIYYIWNADSSKMITTTRTKSYYSGNATTAVNNIPENYVTAYPNPTSDFIVFHFSDKSGVGNVELFDLQGKKVLDEKLNDEQVFIGNLAPGLYLYQVSYDRKKINGKIMIIR